MNGNRSIMSTLRPRLLILQGQPAQVTGPIKPVHLATPSASSAGVYAAAAPTQRSCAPSSFSRRITSASASGSPSPIPHPTAAATRSPTPARTRTPGRAGNATLVPCPHLPDAALDLSLPELLPDHLPGTRSLPAQGEHVLFCLFERTQGEHVLDVDVCAVGCGCSC